jgi:hypothetical protein
MKSRLEKMKQDSVSRDLTYEEERKRASLLGINTGKERLPKLMIVVVLFLEISAMSGMAYLIYLFYFS